MIYKLITKNSELSAELTQIKNAKYIAIDTEFTRQNTFWPKLCTLQICYKNNHAIIIDCLADIDLNLLFEVLYDDNIIKIFHGGKQDLEIFLHLHNKLPQNIFDTQIAAMLINQQPGSSYKNLVYNLLNITLDKTQKISDWTHRPLTSKQIKYAAFDVIYLYQLYENIIGTIISQKKENWLLDIFDELKNKDNYSVNLDKHLSKIHHNPCSTLSYYISKKLFLWREEKALQENRPRNHILHIESIKELSLLKSEDSEAIMEKIAEQFKNIKEKQIQEYALEIFEIIKQCYIEKEENLDEHLPKKEAQLNKIQNILQVLLKEILDNIATKYNIHPNVLALDNDIKKLILYKEQETNKILNGWRFTLFGKTFLDFLNEKKGIYLYDELLYIR